MAEVTTRDDEYRVRTGELPGLMWGNDGWVFPAEALYARNNAQVPEEAEQRRGTRLSLPTAVAARISPRRIDMAPPVLPTMGKRTG